MEGFWVLILVAFFATNSLDKTVSVQLEELPHKIIDEIFGEGWWGNDKDEEWHKLTLEQMSITKSIGTTSSLDKLTNSTDQNPPFTEPDHSGQIEPNSTDQNPPLTEPDHSDNAENDDEQIKEMTSKENIAEDELKRKIVDKFLVMRNEFKQQGKYSANEWTQIENEIAKHLKVNRSKIYKWKKEFGLSQKVFYEKEESKHLVEKFDQMKAELKRAGFKNSYPYQIDKTVAKELGLSVATIYKWKRKFGQTKTNKHSHSEQKELIKRYYEIKDNNSKISDGDIAKRLKIGTATLYKWKKQFKREKFQPNSVDGHSVEVNAAANVQEIGNSNSGNGQ